MPRDGLFAVVLTAGDVRIGDHIRVLSLGNGSCDRTPASAIAEFESEKAAEAAAGQSATARVRRLRAGPSDSA
jgi:MOSC domain-containing protein YiiM